MRLLIIMLSVLLVRPALADEPQTYDIVIYGGTSGGIAAAVQATRMGKSAAVIEPTNRVGGLTTGGLGQTDIGNKSVIGGISREFYQAVRQYYSDPEAWNWQTRQQYQDSGQTRTAEGEDAMWTFEPSAALKIYQSWIDENQIPVFYGERLNRQSGVVLRGSSPARITSIQMESGMVFNGSMFLDASYEGDLMAAAGVAYTVGREANSHHGETLNGVQTAQAIHHQLVRGVDPNITAGDPNSGLLPFLEPAPPSEDGAGDHRVQAYCFRMCLTDHDANRIPFHKPPGYDPQWYELLLRNYEAGEKGLPWINSSMPNRKTDTNNRLGFSTDFIGQNYDYPEASYQRRDEIAVQHRLYQQGLMWTLANHPRMPEHIRREVSRWGMCKDEFPEGNGWQEQLYVREARRLVSDYVMTQHHCQGREEAEDSVGMAAYTMDSHHVQRYVDANGHARNEGDVQVGGFSPYPISYRSIVPSERECENLLVPICLSASHIAFGSIRMEPVFMVLGQSAATAAAHAIDEQVGVQRIDYKKLQNRLLADNQVLKWTGPRRTPPPSGIDPSKLPGIVVDDNQATLNGFTPVGTTVGPFVGSGYRHDGDSDKGHQQARFTVKVDESGLYQVSISYSAHPNRASNVPVYIQHADGETTVQVDQRKTARIDKLFEPLGKFPFQSGKDYTVVISNAGTDGHVLVDALQLLPVDE
jgi:hypothetical protein